MFRLLRYFSILSLFAFVIVTVLLAVLYGRTARKDLVSIEESRNVTLTYAFANSLWPAFAPFLTSASELSGDKLQGHPEITRLHQKVVEMMKGTLVIKVKIYNLDALTVFSTQASQIGEDKSNNAGFLSARSGKVASELTHRDTFSAFESMIEDRDVLSSYIPIRRGGSTGPIEGVFEIYSDVTPLLERIERTQTNVIIGVTLVLTSLYVILFFIVRRADSIIRRQRMERKRAEQALRAAKDYAQNLIDSSLDMIISVDLHRNIVEFNRAAEQSLGYSKAELIDQPINLLYADPSDSLRVQTAISTHGTFVGEVTNKKKSGEAFDSYLSASVIRDAGGRVVGIMGISRDITERKQREEEIKDYAVELKRSNQELEQFAYVASHDLQEPLRMVTSYLRLLEKRYKDQLDADANEFIGFAADGAIRMQGLIHDLLAYSRVTTRAKPFKPVDSEALLNQTLANLQIAITESRAVVTRDSLPTVMADETQLRQVFQNLIGNAIKFRGEQPPQIHLSAQNSRESRGSSVEGPVPDGNKPKTQDLTPNTEWLFSVRDNGIGINPEQADRIFGMFQRLHGKTEYPGTGIGLAICKRIIERHGGRIWVESQPGKGSTFYWTLPDRGGTAT